MFRRVVMFVLKIDWFRMKIGIKDMIDKTLKNTKKCCVQINRYTADCEIIYDYAMSNNDFRYVSSNQILFKMADEMSKNISTLCLLATPTTNNHILVRKDTAKYRMIK